MVRPVLIIDLDHCVYSWLDDMRDALFMYAGVPREQTAPEPKHWDLSDWHVPQGLIKKAWQRSIEDGHMYRTQPPIGGAATIDALWQISDAEYHIHYATSRLNQHGLHHETITATVDWLQAYGLPYRSLSFTDAKSMRGFAMVDDSPRHLADAEVEHKLIYTARHNEGDTPYVRVNDWQDILFYLNEVAHG